jgi:hypothetical protein
MDVRMPDGTIITNVPEDITQDELLAKYQAYTPTPTPDDDAANFQLASEKPLFGEESQVTRSPYEAFMGSLKGIAESTRQAGETPIFGATEAFERSQKRREEIKEKPGFSLEQIQGEFERGTIPGLVETAKQIPSGFGTYLGYAFPSLVAYAGAPLVGLKSTLGRMFLSGSTSLLPQFGEGMTRQAEVQLERGEPIDIDVAKALYTSVGQAALDVIPINKILGPLVTPKKLKDAERIIKSKPNKTLETVTDGLITAELEAGTEITQQLLERWQAGLPLFDEEAIKEYKEVGALSLFAGPLGAYSGYKNIQNAEGEVRRADDEEKRLARIKKINEQRDIDEFNKVQAMRDNLMERWQNRKDPEEEDTFEQLKNMTTESIDGVDISLPVKSKLLQQLQKYQADYDKAEAKEKERIAKQAIDELTDVPKNILEGVELSNLRLIDKKLIQDLGVAPNSAAARNILGLDPTNPAHADKIKAILSTYLENLITSPTANAERAQKAETAITDYLQKIGTQAIEDKALETGAGDEDVLVNPLLKDLISSDTFLPLPSDPDAKLQYLRNIFVGNRNYYPVQSVSFEEDVAAGDLARYEKMYNDFIRGKKKVADFKEIQDGTITQPSAVVGEGLGTDIPVSGEPLRDISATEPTELNRPGVIGPPSYVREFEGRIEQQRASLKDIKKQERAIKTEAKPTEPTLKQFLSMPENRISDKDMLDIMNETKIPKGNPGYFRAFSKNPAAEDLMTRIELGRLDRYLPFDLQSNYKDPVTGLGFDSRAAYDYIAEAMSSDKEILHEQDQESVGPARTQLEEIQAQRKEIEGTIQQEEENLKIENANADLVEINRDRLGIKPMESRQRAPQTPEFKNWFGKSKVTNIFGSPKIVYHGSTKDFDVFKSPYDLEPDSVSERTMAWRTGQQGIYFSDNPTTADAFAGGSSGAKIIPTYLKIEKPYYINKLKTPYNRREKSLIRRIQDKIEKIDGPYGSAYISTDDVKELKSKGYDGIIASGYKRGEKHYIVFDPTQIKSAIGNQGTFDPTDPRIQMSQAEAQITQETPASIIDAMRKVFGENVAKGIKSGLINIVPDVESLPKPLQRQLSPTVRAAFLGDKAYFIANRITREAAPQMLLHEIGAHYGLERMLGKNYKNIVTNLINNKDKDKQIKEAFEQTAQFYPDLKVNSPDFIQEVIANLGERAPKNTLFQRIINLIRNFLTRLGYGWNTKNLSARDIANMVQLSTIQSLKNEGRYKTGRHSSLALASDENVEAPMFYSALKRAVVNAKQDKMPPKEWASWLKGNAPKLGVKQAELDATGILDILNGNLMPTFRTFEVAMEKNKIISEALASPSMSKADLLNIINNQAIELGEKIYGAGAIEALDIPDKQAYIEGMVEEWRAEKENGLEERLWEEAFDNYDPYYYTRSITKEELGAESNRRDMAILEINQLANIQLDAEARAYGSEDLNNLREEIIDQINKEGEIFFVSTQDGISYTADNGRIYLDENEAYEVVDEYDRPYLEEYHDSLVNEARREIDREEESVREDAETFYNDEYGDGQTKYKQYTLPGGDNYTELLITNPNAIALVPGPEGERIAARFQSSHFDGSNIVAHVRMTGRTNPDTGKSVLFVEEIQSDWGQKGRERGFKRELTEDEKQQLEDLNKDKEQLSERLRVLNSSINTYIKISSDADRAKEQAELTSRVSAQKLALILNKTLGLDIINDNMYGTFIDLLAFIGALKANLKIIDTLDSETIQSYLDFPEGYSYMYSELRNLQELRSEPNRMPYNGIVYNYIRSFLTSYEEEAGKIEGFADKLNDIMSAFKTPEFKTWLDEFDKYYMKSTEALSQAALLRRDAAPINFNYREIAKKIINLEDKASGIDSAPFVTDTKAWTELAIKRIARWAVDNNYDDVAFINGLQSSRRYSLATAFDEIAITRSEDGKTYTLAAKERDTDDFSNARTIEKNVPENELAAYVGTELAEKAKKIDPGITDIFDTNLRGPNKSFDYFYDQIIPSIIKQVTKKIGGEPTKFNLSSIPEMQDDEIGAYIGMQTGFKITPEMKKNIAGGMPLFSKQPKVLESRQRPEETRADGSPIKYYTDERTRLEKGLQAIKESTPDSRKSTWKRFTDMLGVKIIGGRYTVERKAIDADMPEVTAKQQGRIRGDLINLQALNNVALTQAGLFKGRLKRNPSGMIIADESTGDTKVGVLDVTQAWNDLLATATEELGSEAVAYDLLATGWYGPRYQEIKRYNETVGEDNKINIDEWTESDQRSYEEAYRRYGEELKAIRDLRNVMRKDVLNFLVETGLYTREKAEDYLNKLEYVALYRIPEDALEQYENQPFRRGAGLLGAGREYRLLGSDRAAADPLENFITNMSWLMQRGIKNNAVKATADLLQELGQGEYMDRPMTPGEKKAFNYVLVNVNGKPKEFIVDDPSDMAAFASSPVLTGLIWDIVNFPVRLLRRGITMMPQFVWNQAWEDPIRATLVSGNKAGFASNIKNTWTSILRNQFTADLSPNAELLNRYGIIGQKDILDEIDIINQYKGKDKEGFRKYLFFLERMSHGSDLGARESIFQNAVKELEAQGYDRQTAEDYAALKSLQYLPYQQIGQSRTLAYLRRMMPFINPPIQGMFRELEAMRGRVGNMTKAEGKKAFLFRIAKYAAFTATYTAFMSGDDDYENETDYNKDNNFFIGGIRVAVPRELAPLKVAIERGTRAYVLNYDRADLESPEVAGAIIRKLWELGAGFLPMPTVATPIIENVTNFDLFTARPLVSPSLQRREPKYQFNDNTSEVAKVIGNSLNVSPIKVDNFIRGYLGYMGATLGEFSNYMANDRPDKRPSDLLFIGNIIQNEYGTGPRQRFYKLYDKVNTATGTVNYLTSIGKKEELKDYVEKNRGYLGVAPYMNKINSKLSDLRLAKRQITASNMSGEEKRKRIDKIDASEIKMLNAAIDKLDRAAMSANK